MFSDNCGAALIRNSRVFHRAVLKVFPSVRYGMLRYRAVGDSEAPEQDSNIVYGFHLIPIYNRAQFVDKTDPCCSAHAGRGGVDRCRYGMPSGYNVRDPFSGPCWRCTCLPVLTLECRARVMQ